MYGYISIVLSQNVREDTVIWKMKSIFDYLAEIGGQAVSLIAILSFLVSHFQNFSYDESNTRALFFHERDDDDMPDGNGEEDQAIKDPRDQMLDSIAKRRNIKIGYFNYLLVKIMTACCCCLTSRYETRKGSCCRRRIRLVKAFELAREKLGEELDMVSLLKFQRISKVSQKVVLKRPERLLVDFFKRYIV